jgi:arylsulfatase
MYDVPQRLPLPKIINLLTDRKEEHDVGIYETWICRPNAQDHR